MRAFTSPLGSLLEKRQSDSRITDATLGLRFSYEDHFIYKTKSKKRKTDFVKSVLHLYARPLDWQ